MVTRYLGSNNRYFNVIFLVGVFLTSSKFTFAQSLILEKTSGPIEDSQKLSESFKQSIPLFLRASDLQRRFSPNIRDTGSSLSVEERSRWLGPSSSVKSQHSLIISLAKLVTDGSQNDLEKVITIHNFVLWRITHGAKLRELPDQVESRKRDKVHCFDQQIKLGKKPNWENCGFDISSADLDDNYKAIIYLGVHNCAGYVYLFTALARAVGIPTRVIKEVPENVNHFWTQVFIQGQWLVIDPTFDDDLDDGSDLFDKQMRYSFDYFLITPDKAAASDDSHKNYVISSD